MKLRNRFNIMITVTGVLLITIAASIKIFGIPGGISVTFVRTGLYILLCSLWIISICWRVVQKRVRQCLITVAGLEIFWLLIRWIKYEVLKSEAAARFAWYFYYLPMLMIPALCIILPFLMGKPENNRLAKPLLLFPAVSFLLFILVITNDIHGLVFILSDDIRGLERLEVGNYSYGMIYWIIAVYAGLCAVNALGLIFFKCRVTNRKVSQVAALFPFVAGWGICIVNVMGIIHLFGVYRIDVTCFICVCVTATLEACIQNGLILTNSGYEAIFRMSSISTAITDKEFSPIIFSDAYKEISVDDMRSTVKAPVMLENGIRLSSSPIKLGYVLWQDDLSELNDTLKKYAEVNEYLKGKNDTIQKDYEYQRKERLLAEKNRLYNNILTQTKDKIEYYADTVEKLDKETDPEKIRQLAVKTAFISAFIKRRINIIFLDEENEKIDPRELHLSIEESLKCLRGNRIECLCSMNLEKPLTFERMTELYERFCDITERIMDDISSLCVYLIEEKGKAVILMRTVSGSSLSHIPEACDECGEWVIKIA